MAVQQDVQTGVSTGSGALQGAQVGSAAGPYGTAIGAVLGAALGFFSGGGGGLFGGKPSLSHAQREAREAQRALAGAGTMIGEIDRARTWDELYAVLKSWQTGYVGGTKSPAVDIFLEPPPVTLTGSQWGAHPRLDYLGLYSDQLDPKPSSVQFFRWVVEFPNRLGASIQQGVSPGMLGGGNEAIRQHILDAVSFLYAEERSRAAETELPGLGNPFSVLKNLFNPSTPSTMTTGTIVTAPPQQAIAQAGMGSLWWLPLAAIGVVMMAVMPGRR